MLASILKPSEDFDRNDAIADALIHHPLFAGVENETIAQFTHHAQPQSLHKGTILFIQEDVAERFYLVQHGWVKLFRETLEGTEAVIDVLTTGSMFGESSVFEQDHYSYGAQAVESCGVIALPTSLLKQAIEADNRIAVNMLSVMSRHRRQQSREIEHLNVQNASQRIGCFLLRLCPTDTTSSVLLHLPYDKTLIAMRLGMKPETFSRAMARLKEATNLEINGASVLIKDMDQLVTYTCNHCSDSFPCDDMKT